MIKQIERDQIPSCVRLIRESFMTVAREFSITQENSPRFTAFSTDEHRLVWQLETERRSMYGYFEDGEIIGYYSILAKDGECELNNLCVHPDFRHRGIGARLLEHCFESARQLGCSKINIGIVEENVRLRKWYESFGFVHTGTQKFDFFSFTCGYMERSICMKEIIFSLENKMWQCARNRDVQGFAQLVDTDAVMVCGGWRCSGEKYAELIADFDIDGYEIAEFELVAQSSDVVQSHYLVKTIVNRQGYNDLAGLFHVTSTWCLKEGTWKLVFNMDSRI